MLMDAAGIFVVGTQAADDGALPGEYVVTIQWYDNSRAKEGDQDGPGESEALPGFDARDQVPGLDGCAGRQLGQQAEAQLLVALRLGGQFGVFLQFGLGDDPRPPRTRVMSHFQ